MEFFEESIEEAFLILFEGASEGIVVVNSSQHIVATNESARAIFGYEKKELDGKHLNTLIPPSYHEEHQSHFKDFMMHSMKREMGKGINLFGLHRDGTSFPVEAGLNPFTLHGHRYVMALVTDITERKESETELKHWANIFHESLNEIFIFDAETLKFVNVNKGAQKNIGYTGKELAKMTPVDIKPEYTLEQFEAFITPLVNGKKSRLVFDTKHKRKDGTTYPVEVHLQTSMSEGRKTIVAIILDITERVNYTERLEKTVEERTHQLEVALDKEKDLNDLKTKFLSLVSHEFKTPLSGISTSAALIGKYPKEEQQEKREKHINTIKSKVKYLNTIIDDFLSIERLDTGKSNYKYSEFPLSKVLNEVIYDANMHLKDGQHILYPKNADDIVLYFDEKILELSLSNLIHNAIKYSGEHTTVSVKAVQKKEHVLLQIMDQGIGIPQEEQRFIFDRYFRAANVLLNPGTGIGLNIVKGHLENLGAQINFESVENEGSTFSIRIPDTKNKES